MIQSSLLRSNMSASTPAGSVKRKKGRVANVDIRERRSGDVVIVFMSQVAAMSYADTALPERRLASHRLRKIPFLRGVQIEALLITRDDSTGERKDSDQRRNRWQKNLYSFFWFTPARSASRRLPLLFKNRTAPFPKSLKIFGGYWAVRLDLHQIARTDPNLFRGRPATHASCCSAKCAARTRSANMKKLNSHCTPPKRN
jgi:hypothetical protein